MKYLFIIPAIVLLTTPTHAQKWQYERHGSTVHLRPTTEPGAVAEVYFDNTSGDSGTSRMKHEFQLGDVMVTVYLGMVESDIIKIEPPEGYWADPPYLDLPDGQSGIIYIRPLSEQPMM
jgi:hypothetical protein